MNSSYWDWYSFSFSHRFSSGEIGVVLGLPQLQDDVDFVFKWASPPCNLDIKKHHPFRRCIVLRIDFCNQTHFSILRIAHDKMQLFPVVLENEITGLIFFYNCTFYVFCEKWNHLIFQKKLDFMKYPCFSGIKRHLPL